MELMPNKSPLEMTIHEMFERLTLVLEKVTREEREQFKKAWVEGAKRMNQERQKRQRNS